MRKVTNNNELPFSVLLADGGLQAIYPGKTETVDLDEAQVDYYKGKGFEVGEPIEAKEPTKEAAPAPAAPAAQAGDKTPAPAQPAVAPVAPAPAAPAATK